MTRAGKSGSSEKKFHSRGERLAAALRENLRRRKAQERGRGSSAADSTKKTGEISRDEPKR